MKTLALVIGLIAALCATAAPAMSAEQFLASAARIPPNPAALLHPAARRLTDEARACRSPQCVERAKPGSVAVVYR